MKAYTDIEQSEKLALAEILPLKSADNVIVSFGNKDSVKTVVIPFETYNTIDIPFSDIREVIPCWSLAALLSVLPYPSLHKTFSGWRCDSYNKEGTSCIMGNPSNNPIDTCYEIITYLHELKML